MIKYFYLFLLTICFSCISGSYNNYRAKQYDKNNALIIWAHSDIQPRNNKERNEYILAHKDIKKNFPNISMAILAGDIVHSGKGAEKVYAWFDSIKSKSLIPYWYIIAGNHENFNQKAFLNSVQNYLHYSITVGNIVFIFMSDISRKPYTVIPDDVFRWWKGIVIANQDKIIVTVTHAALKESGHFAVNFPSMRIKDSERFINVLKKYRVDLWISGHSHTSQCFRRKWTIPDMYNSRTMFLEVSSIRTDFFSAVESYIIIFEKGKKSVILLPRNHEKQHFRSDKIIKHTIGHPFIWNGSRPKMSIYNKKIIQKK